MIPKDTVDAILQATIIEEVVGDFVQLKKSGTSMRGMSPFTNEKTPSFYVVPGKGIFKDFSSGKGGSAVTFLMEHEKLSYPEALRWLARKYGIEIEERQLTPEELEEQTERESLSNLVGLGPKVVFGATAAKPARAKAWAWDISAAGASPTRPSTGCLGLLSRAAVVRRGCIWPWQPAKRGTRTSGLWPVACARQREDGTLYDFYRGASSFPSGTSPAGSSVLVDGRSRRTRRSRNTSTARRARCMTSPVRLYGIHMARNAIVREDRSILVEGYTDVMAMRQAGVEHVVASSGTALTVEQVQVCCDGSASA